MRHPNVPSLPATPHRDSDPSHPAFAADRELWEYGGLGFGVWAGATAVYQRWGALFFEGSAPAYWLNVAATAAVLCAALGAVWRARGLAPGRWPAAALAFALPGMAGEVAVMSTFGEMMTSMRPATAGRYAAFLFAGYTALLAFGCLAPRLLVRVGRNVRSGAGTQG